MLMGRINEHEPLGIESFILIALGLLTFAVAIFKGVSESRVSGEIRKIERGGRTIF